MSRGATGKWYDRLPWQRYQGAPIGVDFASTHLNLLQLAETGGRENRPRLQAAVSVPYAATREALFEEPAQLRKLVRSALATGPFIGREIYATLPSHALRIVPLTVQLGSGQSEAQAVVKAAQDQLGTGLQDAVVDYYHVRSIEADSAERQVLVAVAQKKNVVAYLDSLRSAGLTPLALDIGPAAIARLLGALHREDFDQAIALINFGIDKSYLTVVWGRRLLLDREIDFCENRLVARICEALGLSAAMAQGMLREHGVGGAERGPYMTGGTQPEVGQTLREILHGEFAQLVEELSRTQVYVASRTRGSLVSQIYLNGSIAPYPNLAARIHELVALPVDLLKPMEAFDIAMPQSVRSDADASVALAAGLALRGGPYA